MRRSSGVRLVAQKRELARGAVADAGRLERPQSNRLAVLELQKRRLEADVRLPQRLLDHQPLRRGRHADAPDLQDPPEGHLQLALLVQKRADPLHGRRTFALWQEPVEPAIHLVLLEELIVRALRYDLP